MKTIKEHNDRAGNSFKVGDYVAFPTCKTQLGIGQVIKLTPKGANILGKSRGEYYYYKYNKPLNAIVKINNDLVFNLKIREQC